MDHALTKSIQAWLDQPAAERDYSVGLNFLLKLSNNQIMCRNLERNPAARADFIEYQIRKYQKFRLANLTHEEVEQMQVQVAQIAKSHGIPCDCPNLPKMEAPVQSAAPSASPDVHSSEFRAGKRADHDSLPTEIQALYVENADIMHRMRELHLKLRTLSVENATCPDSERYPFLKEIIDLDKQYHKNWNIYDHFELASVAASVPSASAEVSPATVPSASPEVHSAESTNVNVADGTDVNVSSEAATTSEESTEEEAPVVSKAPELPASDDPRMEQKQIYRQINLTKGRYKKAPTDALKQQIASLYAQLTSPVESLTLELKSLSIIS